MVHCPSVQCRADDGEGVALEIYRSRKGGLPFEYVCDLHEARRGRVGGDDGLRLGGCEPEPFQGCLWAAGDRLEFDAGDIDITLT